MYKWDCLFKISSTKYQVLALYEESNLLRKVLELDFVPSTDIEIGINGHIFTINRIVYDTESSTYAVALSHYVTTPKNYNKAVLQFVESGWKVI